MGCNIHAFIEVESEVAGEYDSLYDVQMLLPRHYALFGALAGVRGTAAPLFPPRGVPPGLGVYGFGVFFRTVVNYGEALEYRGTKIALPHEAARGEILPDSVSPRWGASELGYILDDSLETPSWLSLAEFKQAVEHAGLTVESLPIEYRYVLASMETAEAMMGRPTRFVFWFAS